MNFQLSTAENDKNYNRIKKIKKIIKQIANKKRAEKSALLNTLLNLKKWCERRDSNPHGRETTRP